MEPKEPRERKDGDFTVAVGEWFNPLIHYNQVPEELLGRQFPVTVQGVSRFNVTTFWDPKEQEEYVYQSGDAESRIIMLSVSKDPYAPPFDHTKYGVEIELADGNSLVGLFMPHEEVGAIVNSRNWFASKEHTRGTIWFNETNGELLTARFRISEIPQFKK